MSFPMRRETAEHIALIVAMFAVLFFLRNGFMPGQAGCDEPVFIKSAIYFWGLGRGAPLLISPLYIDIITPFVAIFFDAETGFIVWRILILLTTILLLYFNVARLARPWVGLVVALHFQLLVVLFMTGTYFVLAMAWVLACNLIMLYRPNGVGWVAGLLLLGLFIRGELGLIFLVFLVLCMVFEPRVIFNRRFLLRFSSLAAVFVGVIYWHDSSLTDLPRVFSDRGSLAYMHYIGKTMHELGYIGKYSNKPWGYVEIPAMDRAFRDMFGKTLTDFRAQGGLNLREMFAANPEFMRTHYRRVFASALETVPDAFAPDIFLPSDAVSLRRRIGERDRLSRVRLAIHLAFACFAVLPVVVDRLRGRSTTRQCAPLTRQAVFLMLAPLSALATWFLTMPMAHYIIFIVPTTYFMLILLARGVEPRVVGCEPGTT